MKASQPFFLEYPRRVDFEKLIVVACTERNIEFKVNNRGGGLFRKWIQFTLIGEEEKIKDLSLKLQEAINNWNST
jgi:hypothetical protein